MHFRHTITALATLLLTIAHGIPLETSANDEIPPPAGTVRLRALTYGGSGCPQGSLTTVLDSGATSINLQAQSFVANVSPISKPDDQRKFCSISFNLLYPANYQFAVDEIEYRGVSILNPGVKATVKATTYFSGSPAQRSSAATFTTPRNGEYTTKLTPSGDSASNILWSPCGSTEALLNISTSISVERGPDGASGFISVTSPDYVVKWRKC